MFFIGFVGDVSFFSFEFAKENGKEEADFSHVATSLLTPEAF